jgi:hypothetical protein
MKKIFLGGVLTLLLSLSTFVTPAPARAAWSDCGPNRLCAWALSNGTGTRYEFPSSWYYPGECWLVPSYKGYKKWTSVWNRLPSGQSVNIYNNDPCFLPSAVTIQNNQQVNLANLGFNDINAAFRIF